MYEYNAALTLRLTPSHERIVCHGSFIVGRCFEPSELTSVSPKDD